MLPFPFIHFPQHEHRVVQPAVLHNPPVPLLPNPDSSALISVPFCRLCRDVPSLVEISPVHRVVIRVEADGADLNRSRGYLGAEDGGIKDHGAATSHVHGTRKRLDSGVVSEDVQVVDEEHGWRPLESVEFGQLRHEVLVSWSVSVGYELLESIFYVALS